MSTALLTDHYELTMLRAALESGAASQSSVFEIFARSLPTGRRYGVVAGSGRFLDALTEFRFGDAELTALREHHVVDDRTASWLADYRFSGSVHGLAEGEAYFPDTPVLIVEGSFAECVLLETLALSIFNHDSAIASAAARMTCAARERPCVEMGSRRTHEQAAVAAARAAYIAGFSATSNLEAGRRYGIPTSGTSAHAFTLAHTDEKSAFTAQVASLGRGTTLLVDTYDVLEGVRTAVEVAGPELGAVRLDSGDLGPLAVEVRNLLNELGATNTRIVVTSDLNEFAIAGLSSFPVDSYGVGTSLVTGSGAPTAGFVYKLVERDGVAVEKRSANKRSHGGRKTVFRRYDGAGRATGDVVSLRPEGALDTDVPDGTRPLLRPLVIDGERQDDGGIEGARQHLRDVRAELPREALRLSRGEPALVAVFE
ncbi:MAG TPA: nicotinate phosphoribosyltransferase [Frankiaceae bacterium]|nr:nicotinate phosphoribosyltransferase [Frankiaceae bacterium]